MPRRVVKCEKRAPRDFSPTFYHLCHHSKKPDGSPRSLPSTLTPGIYTTKSATTRNGVTGTRTPRRRFAVGVVGTVTPQIAASAIPLRSVSLFLNFRTGSENIELRRVTRYMCTNNRARERHVQSFIARCKCFLSRSPAWEATDGRILTSREQDMATKSETKMMTMTIKSHEIVIFL